MATRAKFDRDSRALKLLSVISALALAFGAFLAVGYAGTDVSQGHVQRILYFHVPSFAGAFIAYTTAALSGVMFLKKRQVKWDILALSAVEVGFVLALINMVLGSIWARSTWNTWWTGDSRMVASVIMMLIGLAYPLLRNGIANPERRRLVGAMVGFVLMAAMVYTTLTTRLRADTIHPVVFGASPQNTQGGIAMTTSMRLALYVNFVAWGVLLTPTLIWWRVRLENLAAQIAEATNPSET